VVNPLIFVLAIPISVEFFLYFSIGIQGYFQVQRAKFFLEFHYSEVFFPGFPYNRVCFSNIFPNRELLFVPVHEQVADKKVGYFSCVFLLPTVLLFIFAVMKLSSALTGLYFFLSVTGMAQIHLTKLSEEFVFNNPAFRQCHASTIVEISPGKFMSAAFGGKEEGNNDVCIWLSIKDNNEWSKPLKVGEGIINDTLRYPCWNPVLFKIKEGKLFLFYKVGPSPRTWWGMVRTSMDNGRTWSTPERLPEGILGPIKNKPVQLADGTILSPSSSETGGNWKVHMEKSVDLGKTWQLIAVDPSTAFNVIQPSILIHANKRLQILCRSQENTIMQSYSDNNGNTWGSFTKSELPNPNSGTDAITLINGHQLIVYNPTTKGKGGRAKLVVASSTDGQKWTEEMVLENHEEGEYSYPAVIQSADGRIHITYTYNRSNVKYVVLEMVK